MVKAALWCLDSLHQGKKIPPRGRKQKKELPLTQGAAEGRAV